jgi:hypothetical protein
MATRGKYTNYSIEEKLNHIYGIEKSIAPRSTTHFWDNKGKANIEQLGEIDGLKEMVFFNQQVLSASKDALLHSLDFFINIVSKDKSLLKHYKNERIEFVTLIEKMASIVPLNELLNTIGYTKQQYYTLKNKINCVLSPINSCLNSALNQFDNQFITDLQNKYFKNEDFANFSLSDLFAKLKNDKILFISFAKFCDIAKTLGEYIKRKKKQKKKYPQGRKANQVNELLHADKTMYKLSNGRKVWIYLICDNFSRKILAAHVSYSSKSKESLLTLKKPLAIIILKTFILII